MASRKPLKIGILAAAILIIAAVYFARRSFWVPQTAQVPITIAQFGEFFLYMPLYIAQDKGFFADEGLKVSIVNTGGDEKTFAAVLSGDAQFGVSDPTFVAIANERGQRGKVVASIVSGVPFWGVTKRKDIEPIKSPKDLKGLSVATFPSPSTAYTLQARMFKEAGLRPNIRQGAFGTLLALLEARQADIALELEPNVSTAVKQGAKVVYSLSQVYGDFAITGLMTSEKVVRENPALVQRVVNALERAMKFAHTDQEGVIEFARQRFPGLDPEVSKNAIIRVIKEGTLPRHTQVSLKGWVEACRLRYEVGDLKSLDNVKQLVDHSFAQIAAEKWR